MPMYAYRCACGAVRDQFARVSDRDANIPECHGPMVRQLSVSAVSIQADCHVRSPIDGTPLTSRRGRDEYMKRNDLKEALPAAEVIRDTDARVKATRDLGAKLGDISESVKQRLYQEAGFPA